MRKRPTKEAYATSPQQRHGSQEQGNVNNQRGEARDNQTHIYFMLALVVLVAFMGYFTLFSIMVDFNIYIKKLGLTLIFFKEFVECFLDFADAILGVILVEGINADLGIYFALLLIMVEGAILEKKE
ncbi:hypothetical protein ACJX0J_025267 [Zea mays]